MASRTPRVVTMYAKLVPVVACCAFCSSSLLCCTEGHSKFGRSSSENTVRSSEVLQMSVMIYHYIAQSAKPTILTPSSFISPSMPDDPPRTNLNNNHSTNTWIPPFPHLPQNTYLDSHDTIIILASIYTQNGKKNNQWRNPIGTC